MTERRTGTAHDPPAMPTRRTVRDRDEAMDQATAILAVHVPDPDDGTCHGCLALWNRWIRHPDCPQVTWARRVIETYAPWDDDRPLDPT